MKYHRILLLMAALLCGLTSAHAGASSTTAPRYLWINIEQQPGKDGSVTCLLNARGEFKVIPDGADPVMGTLPVQESGRILEEFEKICRATGEGSTQPDALNARFVGGARVPIGFAYTTPQGEMLQMAAPDNRLSPQMNAFLRILWQKLLYHAAKHPRPVPADPFAPAKK